MQANFRPSLVFVFALLVADGALAASDVLTIGSAATPAGGTAAIPIFIRDVSGTTLNANASGAPAIQTIQFKINFSAPEKIAGCAGGTFPDCQVDFEPAAIFSSHKPVKSEVVKSFSSIRVLYQFDRTTDRIAYDLDLAAPGNLIGYLFVTLASPLTEGDSVALQLDPASTATFFQDTATGSTFSETFGNGLSLVDGAVTVSSTATACDAQPTSSNTVLSWTGFSSGCSPGGGSCRVSEGVGFQILGIGYTFPSCAFVRWSFGDGSVSNLDAPAHTFSAQGTYTVTAAISTPSGNLTLPANVTVTSGATAQCPVATSANTFLTWSGAVSGCSPSGGNCAVGETINFSAFAFGYSLSQCASILTWNFGDGSSASGTSTSVSHTYGTTLSSKVELTVTQISGSSLTLSAPIQIGSVGPAPCTVCSALGPTNGEVNTPLIFVAISNCNPATYTFDFADGPVATITSDSALHAFTTPGTYKWKVSMAGCEAGGTVTISPKTVKRRRRGTER